MLPSYLRPAHQSLTTRCSRPPGRAAFLLNRSFTAPRWRLSLAALNGKYVMHIRSKVRWLAAGALPIVLGLIFLGMHLVPARPGAAVQRAHHFVRFLQVGAWEQAYALTDQQTAVGKTLGDFRRLVARQWPGTPPASVRLLSVRPFQSYGNRWRRWAAGREVEQTVLHLEFTVDGVPFEVRERYAGHGEWKVNYFQSHAG